MYQLSRLLHDYHKDLQCHLEQQDIAPSLYAPPWFLTNFASQYPLGFVARVFGRFEGNGRVQRNVCLKNVCTSLRGFWFFYQHCKCHHRSVLLIHSNFTHSKGWLVNQTLWLLELTWA